MWKFTYICIYVNELGGFTIRILIEQSCRLMLKFRHRFEFYFHELRSFPLFFCWCFCCFILFFSPIILISLSSFLEISFLISPNRNLPLSSYKHNSIQHVMCICPVNRDFLIDSCSVKLPYNSLYHSYKIWFYHFVNYYTILLNIAIPLLEYK